MELLFDHNVRYSYSGHHGYNGPYCHKSVIIVSKTANIFKLNKRYPMTCVECCGVLRLI